MRGGRVSTAEKEKKGEEGGRERKRELERRSVEERGRVAEKELE